MDSQYGLMNLWTLGDVVTKGVALLLLAMSLASWMVIIVKVLDLRRYATQARQTEGFWHSTRHVLQPGDQARAGSSQRDAFGADFGLVYTF